MGIRRVLVRTVATVAKESGALALWRRAAMQIDGLLHSTGSLRTMHRGGLVLLFHRISARSDPFRPGFDVGLFDWLCGFLRDNYTVLSLHEFERRRRAGQSLSRAVALTFDDGFLDNYELALPTLRYYDLPATLFVTTGSVGGLRSLWFSKLFHIVGQASPQRAAHLPAIAAAPIRLDNQLLRVQTLATLLERLAPLPPTERDELIDELARQLEVSDFSALQHEMVSWNQLREMDAAGFSAQPHTITHPLLTRVDDATLERELVEPKQAIEAELGRPADLLAYPRGRAGDFDQRVVDAVKRVGYYAAYNTVPAAVHHGSDPFRLPRVTFFAKTRPALALQIERLFYVG